MKKTYYQVLNFIKLYNIEVFYQKYEYDVFQENKTPNKKHTCIHADTQTTTTHISTHILYIYIRYILTSLSIIFLTTILNRMYAV